MKRTFSILFATMTAVFASLMAAVPAAADPVTVAATCNSYSHVPVVGGGYSEVPSIGSETGNVYCSMFQGSQSSAVFALQLTLNECYLRPTGRTLLNLDSEFGPKTRAALVFAQGMAGAVPDGGYGPETRTKLLWNRWWGSAFCNHLNI